MFAVATATFRLLYALIVLSLDRRGVVHFEVTPHPTQDWLSGQMTEAFPWDTAPRYLLRDRDKFYGPAFRHRVRAMGITEVVTAPRCPWQNPYAERLIGSIRRECLDHVIIFNERHLHRVLASYFSIPSRHPNASLARQGLPAAASRTASLQRQNRCLPRGWGACIIATSVEPLKGKPGCSWSTPSNCNHVNFEQGHQSKRSP
jgi:transposase InsO family protein